MSKRATNQLETRNIEYWRAAVRNAVIDEVRLPICITDPSRFITSFLNNRFMQSICTFMVIS